MADNAANLIRTLHAKVEWLKADNARLEAENVDLGRRIAALTEARHTAAAGEDTSLDGPTW